MNFINNKKTAFILIFISATVFCIVLLRSLFVPFTHDEAATFFYFIQTGNFLPFSAHIDANNHILNSCLSFFSFKLFGDSPFALRLPNLLGFIFLVTGALRLSKDLQNTISKYLLFSFFIVSFHWISFFSVCRGYGLSMGLTVFAFSYFFSYIKNLHKVKYLILFSLFIQLALASNLTLIVLTLTLLAYITTVQVLHKKFFNLVSVLILFINLSIIIFWVYFLFFLKEHNALYLGKGSSFWNVTIESLVTIITGSNNKWDHILITIMAYVILVFSVAHLVKHHLKNKEMLLSNPLFAVIVISLFIFLGIFIQKYFLHINYPEGRAALFIYILFAFIVIYYSDLDYNPFTRIFSLILITSFIIHFLFNINFRKHSIEEYVTIPGRFYDYLEKEQASSGKLVTIGGHPYRELIYNFINYRNNGLLNPENPPDIMQMNCDYYIGHVADSNYYRNYYTVIDSEPDWGFTLLKRKEPVERELIYSSDSIIDINNDQEYDNLFCFNDTSFYDTSPILVEIDFDVIKCPVPNLSGFVLEVNDSANKNNIYKRIPLNWLRYNWNNTKNNRYMLVTENLPGQCKRMVCYYWNFKKENCHLTINNVNIYRLKGNGVNKSAVLH